MKRAMFLAVALAILVSTGAFAQKMVAQVPFGFTANKLELAAGDYTLVVGGSIPNGVINLRNDGAGKSVFVTSANREYTTSDPKPRLVFRCTNGHYALAEVWTADTVGYRVPLPKAPEGVKIQMATVYLTRATNAD